MINFGITGPEKIEGPGINANMNEGQAAMGLAILDDMAVNIERRSAVWHRYQFRFASSDRVQLKGRASHASNNYAYFPVVFATEQDTVRVLDMLKSYEVYARRYFYPSLNTLPEYGSGTTYEVSESIAIRILRLPIYSGLGLDDVDFITEKILSMDLGQTPPEQGRSD